MADTDKVKDVELHISTSSSSSSSSSDEDTSAEALIRRQKVVRTLSQRRPKTLPLTPLKKMRLPKHNGQQKQDKLNVPHFKTRRSLQPSPCETPSTANTEVITRFRWKRQDRRLRRLNTELLEAIEGRNLNKAIQLLDEGANPNATCRLSHVTACHLASIFDCDDILTELLKRGADRIRQDVMGRTPLHLAAWFGHSSCIGILLDFPDELRCDLSLRDLTKDVTTDVKELMAGKRFVKELVNVSAIMLEKTPTLPNEWKDSFDHECRDIRSSIPAMSEGWTPLHTAVAKARVDTARLLVAAGANVQAKDSRGLTPLDVVGYAKRYETDPVDGAQFAETIKLLIEEGASPQSMKIGGIDKITTPLHIAVELESCAAIKALLNIGACAGCLNEDGETPLHLCVSGELEEPLQILLNISSLNLDVTPSIDYKDSKGYSILHSAVIAQWIPGVCIALEVGADVAMQSYDGETPIHAAAASGNLDLLLEILSIAKRTETIDITNSLGETPLLVATRLGHTECVKALIKEGASVTKILPNEVTSVHVAARYGHLDVLRELLEAYKPLSIKVVNLLNKSSEGGMNPLHLTARHNHPESALLLLKYGASIRSRTTTEPHQEGTPLHVAAFYGNAEVAQVFISHDSTTTKDVDFLGWLPIHLAAHHGHRNCITALLKGGSDLSSITYDDRRMKRTALDMLIQSLSRPTDYLEELFDSYIECNGLNLHDTNFEINVNYSILVPKDCERGQMKIVSTLIKSGNRFEQRRLLLHPLVESFLYLKWRALSPFFYGMLVSYVLFVLALTSTVISVYYFKDNDVATPAVFDLRYWSYLLYFSIICIMFQEILYVSQHTSRYFSALETWVKLGSISFAFCIPIIDHAGWAYEWPRHLSTAAILLSWTELMFLISRFPNWGYYVLMFSKVATNVFKILLTFTFLVVGFAFSFMIQFRSQPPFESPWAALIKTIVMMTSEFDYGSLFDDEHKDELATSMLIGRIVFVIFLVLAAIVLMNLMVGVAVSDINDLEIQGKMQRLAKQVDFLSTLDILVNNDFCRNHLPRKMKKRIIAGRNVLEYLTLYPGRPKWAHNRYLPMAIRNDIYKKVTESQRLKEGNVATETFQQQLAEVHKVLVGDGSDKGGESAKLIRQSEENITREMQKRHNEIVSMIEHLAANVHTVKLTSSVLRDNFMGSLANLSLATPQVEVKQSFFGNIPVTINDLNEKCKHLESEIVEIKSSINLVLEKLNRFDKMN